MDVWCGDITHNTKGDVNGRLYAMFGNLLFSAANANN